MRAVLPCLVVLALASSGLAQEEERRVPGFQEAVDALVEQVREAAPEGITVEVNEALPVDLGWRASQANTPARVLVIMAPSGAARVFGLLPREGTYTPDPQGKPQLVAVGPALVVVGASQLLQVAMTLDELKAAKPDLDAASAPVTAWQEEQEADVKTSFVRGEVARVTPCAHHLAIDLKPGGSVDLPAAWKAGHTVIVHRVLPADGSFVPPTVSIAPNTR